MRRIAAIAAESRSPGGAASGAGSRESFKGLPPSSGGHFEYTITDLMDM